LPDLIDANSYKQRSSESVLAALPKIDPRTAAAPAAWDELTLLGEFAEIG